MLIKGLLVVFVILFVWFMARQILLPLFHGTPLFPYRNKKSKGLAEAESELEETREEVETHNVKAEAEKLKRNTLPASETETIGDNGGAVESSNKPKRSPRKKPAKKGGSRKTKK